MITGEQLTALWDEVKRRVKTAELNRPLWRALDAAVPVTLDGRSLVIGLAGELQHEASHFEVAQNRQVIDQVLATIANKPLKLLIIDGTTMADYEGFQARQAAAEELHRKAAGEPAPAAFAAGEEEAEDQPGSVGALLLQMGRELHLRYRELSNRSAATVKARFLLSALGQLYEVEQKLEFMEGTDDYKERQLARAIDRLSHLTDIDELVVALEYERYKREQVYLTRD